MSARADFECKVVTLGEGRVGKTSLLLKYTKGVFHDKEAPSLQANFQDKLVSIEGSRVQMHIWDTAGQERYRAIARNYYRDAQGALIVYDITEPDSFDRVKQWANELSQYGESHVCITIVGNKSDLEARRRVSREEAINFARSMGATHFDTSAKTGRGVAEMFEALGKAILSKVRGARPEHAAKSRGVTITKAEPKSKQDCGLLCRRRRGPGQSTPENAVVTAAEVSLGFSAKPVQQVEYALSKFAAANTLSKAALARAVRDLGLRFDEDAQQLFYAQFQLDETAYDARKLRLAGILMAAPDKSAKAISIWDTWTGAPTEEVPDSSFKELVTTLVELSLESYIPLAMQTPDFSKDRLKVWSKSQAQKKEKAVSHYTELFLPADAKQVTYQHFLEVVATAGDDCLTSAQQMRATIERFRVMSAKFSSAFKKGGFTASLIPNKK